MYIINVYEIENEYCIFVVKKIKRMIFVKKDSLKNINVVWMVFLYYCSKIGICIYGLWWVRVFNISNFIIIWCFLFFWLLEFVF